MLSKLIRKLRERLPGPTGTRQSDRLAPDHNRELLEAMEARHRAETPETLKRFYDAFHTSRLLVAVPPERQEP